MKRDDCPPSRAGGLGRLIGLGRVVSGFILPNQIPRRLLRYVAKKERAWRKRRRKSKYENYKTQGKRMKDPILFRNRRFRDDAIWIEVDDVRDGRSDLLGGLFESCESFLTIQRAVFTVDCHIFPSSSGDLVGNCRKKSAKVSR